MDDVEGRRLTVDANGEAAKRDAEGDVTAVWVKTGLAAVLDDSRGGGGKGGNSHGDGEELHCEGFCD